MALQHADWLGLALGVVRRGPGGVLDAELVQADIDALEDVEGEIEDRDGHLAVLQVALLHLTPLWQDLGVLDESEQFTERGVWGVPRALYQLWSPAPWPGARPDVHRGRGCAPDSRRLSSTARRWPERSEP